MKCELCRKRNITRDDTVCKTCRTFITDYIDTGAVQRQTVPMVADVLFVMKKLGISQNQAVILLGGTP